MHFGGPALTDGMLVVLDIKCALKPGRRGGGQVSPGRSQSGRRGIVGGSEHH